MLIRDHLNLLGGSPLEGLRDEDFGSRFADMSPTWPPELRMTALRAAPRGITVREGVYAACRGPQYETPAEVRMLRVLGADAVGMSTVPEAIVAAQMRVPALGISLVTNHAAGVARQPLEHAEVLAVGRRAASGLADWLERLVPQARGPARARDEHDACRAPRRSRREETEAVTSHETLVKTARAMRKRAYAPYSGYAVGAALLGSNGRVYTGCNVENASYGLTVCAERIAIFQAVADGCRSFEALAVATADCGSPCGACLQVAREFGPSLTRADRRSLGRGAASSTLAELLPSPFLPCGERPPVRAGSSRSRPASGRGTKGNRRPARKQPKPRRG